MQQQTNDHACAKLQPDVSAHGSARWQVPGGRCQVRGARCQVPFAASMLSSVECSYVFLFLNNLWDDSILLVHDWLLMSLKHIGFVVAQWFESYDDAQCDMSNQTTSWTPTQTTTSTTISTNTNTTADNHCIMGATCRKQPANQAVNCWRACWARRWWPLSLAAVGVVCCVYL